MMKTYDIGRAIRRIKNSSMDFNASSIVFNKIWHAFNDKGKKEMYIFKPGGVLQIISNGIKEGKWEWVSGNNSLIINENHKVMIFHPEYLDCNLFVLNLDGTNLMSFLIEEEYQKRILLNTKADLIELIIKKEKEIADEKKQRTKNRILEKQQIAAKQREVRAEKNAKELSKILMPAWYVADGKYAFVSSLLMTFILEWFLLKNSIDYYLIICLLFFIILFALFVILFNAIFTKKAKNAFKKNHTEWRQKRHHSNDRRNAYVEFQPNLRILHDRFPEVF